MDEITIRPAAAADFDLIMEIEVLGFGYEKEARLTAALLADPTAEPKLSLLAFCGHEAVGHVLFTKAAFKNTSRSPLMHILAPLAVKPAYQRRGIGGLLIKKGFEHLHDMGSKMVFVLGHKEYYPRHGFMPHAARAGFPAPYPVPDELGEYWMYQSLSSLGANIGPGQIQCAQALDAPEHWRDDDADKR